MLTSGRLFERSGNLPIGDKNVTGFITPPFARRMPSVILNSSINELLTAPAELRQTATDSANNQAEIHFFLTELRLSFEDQLLSDAVVEYLEKTDPGTVKITNTMFGSDEKSLQ